MKHYLGYILVWPLIIIFWVITIHILNKFIRIDSIDTVYVTFHHWLLVASSYVFTRSSLKRSFLNDEKPVPIWLALILCIASIPTIGIVSMMFQAALNVTDYNSEGEPVFKEVISFSDIAIPMMVSSLSAIFWTVWQHNRDLYQLYSKDFFKEK